MITLGLQDMITYDYSRSSRSLGLLTTHLQIFYVMASKENRTEVVILLTLIWEKVSASAQVTFLIVVKWRVMVNGIVWVPRSSYLRSGSSLSVIPSFMAHLYDFAVAAVSTSRQ